MDPTANLAEQLLLANSLLDGLTDSGRAAERLAELVLALNEWLAKGGFPPEQWQGSER
jgi:hypothetical protein